MMMTQQTVPAPQERLASHTSDERLARFLTELGWEYALAALDFFPEPQRTQALKRLLGKCVEAGRLDKARRVAKSLGRSLTP